MSPSLNVPQKFVVCKIVVSSKPRACNAAASLLWDRKTSVDVLGAFFADSAEGACLLARSAVSYCYRLSDESTLIALPESLLPKGKVVMGSGCLCVVYYDNTPTGLFIPLCLLDRADTCGLDKLPWDMSDFLLPI